MDSKQSWYGNYFRLSDISEFLDTDIKLSKLDKNRHELLITWIVARFLQYQQKTEHFIGFPTLNKIENCSLSKLINDKLILEDINFDTIIINNNDVNKPIRLQIKRYMRNDNPSTKKFYKYILAKVRRYGNAPELSIVFHIREDMKFDIPLLGKLIKQTQFSVGSIIVIFERKRAPKLNLFSIYPTFTGEIWHPSTI